MQEKENRFAVLLCRSLPVCLAFLLLMGFLLMGSSYQSDGPPDKRREDGIESGPASPPKINQDAIPGDANLAADESEGWSQVSGKRIKVNDDVDHDGRVFADDSKQTLLLVPSQGEWAFLLDLDQRHVSALSKSILLWDKLDRPLPDISDPLFIGPLLEYEGDFRFDYGDQVYVIQPIPPIVGERSIEEINELLPEYAHNASKYHPNRKALEALQNVTQDSRFLVFFATWSPLSKNWIPRLMKTLELANNGHLLATFYGVNQGLDQPQFELEEYSVTAVPAVIVVRQNEELGRIERLPQRSIEEDVARILGAMP